MTQWCFSQATHNAKSDLDICVLNYFQIAILVLFFTVISYNLRQYTINGHEYDDVSGRSKVIKNILFYCTIFSSFCSILFEVDNQQYSVLMVIVLTLQIATWMLVAYAIHRESKCLLYWPSNTVIMFYTLELLIYSIYAGSNLLYASTGRAYLTSHFLVSLFIIFLICLLCILSIAKRYFLKEDSHHNISFSSLHDNRSLQFQTIGSQKIYEKGYEGKNNKWGIWSLFSFSKEKKENDDPSVYDPFLENDDAIRNESRGSIDDIPSIHSSNSSPSKQSSSFPSGSPQVNKDGRTLSSSSTGSSDSKQSSSGALQRALSKHKNSSSNLAPMGTNSLYKDFSGATSSSNINGMTDAEGSGLNSQVGSGTAIYVVSVHRWGIRHSSEFGSGLNNHTRRSFDAGRSFDGAPPLTTFSPNKSSTSNQGDNNINDEDRMERIDSIELNFKPEEISDLQRRLQQEANIALSTTFDSPNNNNYNNNNNINNNSYNSNKKLSTTHSEIEFEICVSVARAAASVAASTASDGTSSEQDWWALKKGSAAGYHKWATWKSGLEVLSFHQNLISVMGDLAPRRPKLKSDKDASKVSHSTQLTRHEISDDMRSISAYLNALLRDNNNNMSVVTKSMLLTFLSIDENILNLNSNMTRDSSSGNGGIISVNNSINSNNGNISSGSNNSSSGSSSLSQAGNLSTDDLPLSATGPSSSRQSSNNISAPSNSSSTPIGNAENWRKLYVNMKVKLKPHEVSIRCRVFEGVVSGEEVALWLMKSDNKAISKADGSSNSYQHARDRIEACTIGQEMLNCGLLVAVASGYEDDDVALINSAFGTSPSSSTSVDVIPGGVADAFSDSASPNSSDSHAQAAQGGSPRSNFPTNEVGEVLLSSSPRITNVPVPPFSDLKSYIYRFGDKSGGGSNLGSRVKCIMFGAVAKVSILEWSHADDDDDTVNNSYTRDTLGMQITSGGVINIVDSFSVGSGGGGSKDRGGHVEYLVDVQHGNDKWQVWKRYRTFEQLNKNLLREGIKIDAALPSKSLVAALSLGLSTSMYALESRKLGLETYLRAALMAVVGSNNISALDIIGSFLDDNHRKLRMF